MDRLESADGNRESETLDGCEAMDCSKSLTPEVRIEPSDQILATPDMVLQTLRQLERSCTRGPDHIPNIFLKSCAFSLSYPLHHIFNLSLSIVDLCPISGKQFMLFLFTKKFQLLAPLITDPSH